MIIAAINQSSGQTLQMAINRLVSNLVMQGKLDESKALMVFEQGAARAPRAPTRTPDPGPRTPDPGPRTLRARYHLPLRPTCYYHGLNLNTLAVLCPCPHGDAHPAASDGTYRP